RQLLDKSGLKGVKIQIAGGNTLVINTDARGEEDLRRHERIIAEALKGQFKGSFESGQKGLLLVGRQLVGPVIGQELRRNAINGVILGVALIALWIYIRYNFAGAGLRYAVAGIVALVHDVLVLIGLFALIGYLDPDIEIDGSFIAALLTVVGYSINDSVVIFDRIRENLRRRRREPFNKVVNDSLLETMSRSINTGLTVLIMLFVLLIFGGESIRSFVLAMLVGIASGLYSSIFNASMVLTAWNNYDEKKLAAARAARMPRPARTVTASTTPRPTLSPTTSPTLPATPATEANGPATPRPLEEKTSPGSPAPSRPARKARARRRF
ncbi:MAG: protein translocase subunit SecF, partial [Armatimonadota bacterium]|nr:protein translocase subunit SecF [Armatimonadota bacterium]